MLTEYSNKLVTVGGAYLRPCQTSMMDFFTKIVYFTRSCIHFFTDVPVDIRRRFNVYKTSMRRHRRRIDVL